MFILFLCNKIEILERAGMLAHEDVKLSATNQELARAFAPKAEKIPRPPKPPAGEDIQWDFDEENQEKG